MPIHHADRTRVSFADPLKERAIDKLARDSQIKVLQTYHAVKPATYDLLNAVFFARRPDVELRLHGGFFEGICDLSFARRMTNVRRFSADCLQTAVGVEFIAEIPNLESLSLDIFDLESFDVLNRVQKNLRELYLGSTRSKKPSLTPVARFQQLSKNPGLCRASAHFGSERKNRAFEEQRRRSGLVQLKLESFEYI